MDETAGDRRGEGVVSGEQIVNVDGNVDEDSPIPNKLDSSRLIKGPGPRQ